jgi:hypothetical protein
MNKLKKMFVGVALLFLGTTTAQAVFMEGTGNIDDVDKIAGTFHELTITASGPMTDVNIAVHLTPSRADGTNEHWGDLDMFISHNGVRVQLLDNDSPLDCCSWGANFNILFDDESANVLGQYEASGDYQPQNGMLSAFDGMEVGGEWLLEIFEMEGKDYEGDTMLTSWSVAASVPEPSIIALFGLGLFGLGIARRRKHI